MTRIPGFLRHIVDYAGLFPPSRLPLVEAAANYARYRQGGDRAMLGAFVLPLDRVDDLVEEVEAQGLSTDPPWPVSLLVGTGGPAAGERLRAVLENEARIEVVALESQPASPQDLAAQREIFGPDLPLYAEIPWDQDPMPWVQAAKATGARGKIRCGGVEASMIPPVESVARFLRACIDAELPFKATAGLHHPVRGEQPLTYEDDPPRAVMHGFLNVFVAALLYRCGVVDLEGMHAVLGEEDPKCFQLGDEAVGWRDLIVGAADVARLRPDFATGFGSCSFREPVDDLKSLEIL